MKQWKKILKMFALAVCIGLLAGCGQNGQQVENQEPTVTVAPDNTGNEADSTVSESTPAPTEMPFEIAPDALTGLDAHEIASQIIVGWNLGNSLDATGGNTNYFTPPKMAVKAWGNEEPTKELFEAVKAGGFNTVRIPTTWFQHIRYDKETDSYIINEEWMAYVKQTVDYAYELDLFIILNVHHEEWVNVGQFTDETYETASHMLKDIWSQVAETFANYDQHLIFEGMNEPRQTGLGSSVEWGSGDTKSQKYINNLNQVFVDTIRGQGSVFNSERLLMLPGYAASNTSAAVKAIKIPQNGGNIAISVHAYAPYYFAMASDDKANHSFPGKSGYGEDYESSLDYLFRTLQQIAEGKRVPIIMGECGASDFNNTEDRERWATYFFTRAKEAGIPCVLWDNQATYNGTGEAYGLISRSKFTWFKDSIPMVKAIMEVYGQESSLPAEE